MPNWHCFDWHCYATVPDENPPRGDAVLRGGEEAEARRDPAQRQGVDHHHPQRDAGRRPAGPMRRPRKRGSAGLDAVGVRQA